MYNGYANKETWQISLWLHNTQNSYYWWVQEAESIYLRLGQNNPEPSLDDVVNELAKSIRRSIENNAPELTGLYSDLPTNALSRVNQLEVANSFAEDIGAE